MQREAATGSVSRQASAARGRHQLHPDTGQGDPLPAGVLQLLDVLARVERRRQARLRAQPVYSDQEAG